jgi:lysyl-tRNA synthetase class 2
MMTEDSDLKAQRRKKLRELQEKGLDPFQKYRYERTHGSTELKKAFEKIGIERSADEVSIAGRLMGIRLHGKAARTSSSSSSLSRWGTS